MPPSTVTGNWDAECARWVHSAGIAIGERSKSSPRVLLQLGHRPGERRLSDPVSAWAAAPGGAVLARGRPSRLPSAGHALLEAACPGVRGRPRLRAAAVRDERRGRVLAG